MQVGIQFLATLVDGIEETKIIATNGAGVFVGYVGLQCRNRRAACFRQLFVKELHRGCGFGSELVRRCAEKAQAEGCETLGGLVAKENLDVLPFYKKLGFIFAYEYEEDGSVIIVKLLK